MRLIELCGRFTSPEGECEMTCAIIGDPEEIVNARSLDSAIEYFGSRWMSNERVIRCDYFIIGEKKYHVGRWKRGVAHTWSRKADSTGSHPR